MTLLNNLTQPIAGLAIGAFATEWTAGRVILALTVGMALLGCVSVLAGYRPAAAERAK
jgi:hypothetical protein